jgi:hypothetical protein
MDTRNITTIERAFQLARSGKFQSIEKLKKKLRDEGFDQWEIVGRSLLDQLNTLIKAHR